MQIIDRKSEVLAKQSDLKKPKVKIIKRNTTGVNSNTNVLSVDENLLIQWKAGEISEIDVDGTLAHEFGHLIEHSRDKFGRKSDRQLAFYITALVASLIIYSTLNIPQPALGCTIIALLWTAFLPYILRKIYVSGELAADRNAINFSLISNEKMAFCIANRIARHHIEDIKPLQLLRIIENFVTHPFIKEQLANIGFELERPIKVRKIDQKVAQRNTEAKEGVKQMTKKLNLKKAANMQ